MRIAVISNPVRPTGKTVLSLLLSMMYPVAVGKESVYVTTKSLSEVLKYVTCPESDTSVEKSIAVFSALSRTDSISDKDVVDYAYKPNGVKVMMFDAYNTTVSEENTLAYFSKILELNEKRFTVVDISGDPNTEINKNIIEQCHVTLYTFTPTRRDLEEFHDYYMSLSEDDKLRVIPVCTMWDARGVGKRTVQNITKLKSNKTIWVPYEHMIQKLMLDGNIERAPKLIVDGKQFMITMREPIAKILSTLLDSKQGKVVKEYKKWVV